ncbi:MAG TPA: hypothetical protein VMP68_16635 [Candidatus Eisenbacteria bacterium]|nr:hypothetical protein [Candidatus Eisenbacteria bacterium]
MPTILFVIVVRLVMMSIAAMANHRNAPKPKPLCNECAFAHIQFGACGRSTISCTFGGGVRLLKLDVLYCTDYVPRQRPIRPAIGFIRQVGPSD